MALGSLRIALVSMHTDPFADPGRGDVGGMNVVVKHGALALASLGHEVAVFTRRSSPHDPPREAHGPVTLHRLPAGPPRPTTKAEQEGYVEEFSAGLAEAMARAEGRGQPWQTIHSHHWFSGAAAIRLAREAGLPHVQSFHSIAARDPGDWSLGEQPEGPGRVPAEAMLAADSARVIAVSHAEAETVVQLGAAVERVSVATPGVDHGVFHPGQGDEDPLHLDERATVLVAARLEPLKGIDLAIEILERIPAETRPRLVISGAPTAGFDGYDHELHRLVQEAGLRNDVWFAGPLSREELARAMRRARAVLIPSHSETYGLVALEAAACGTPAIASHVGGLGDAVIHGTTGLLIEGRDPQEWAAELLSLLTDAEYRARLGAAASNRARSLTWESMAEKWVHTYRDSLSDRWGSVGRT